MTPEHVHEEIELQAIDFSSYVTEWIADLPRWRDYYLAEDQTSSYAYMKKVLKVLQFLRGPKRWILKSPQHLEQIGPLLANFPSASFAVVDLPDPLGPISVTISPGSTDNETASTNQRSGAWYPALVSRMRAVSDIVSRSTFQSLT